MKQETLADGTPLVEGNVYRIKTRGSGSIVRARFKQVDTDEPIRRFDSLLHERRATKRYYFTNLATGRELVVRSRQVIYKDTGESPKAAAGFKCGECGQVVSTKLSICPGCDAGDPTNPIRTDWKAL